MAGSPIRELYNCSTPRCMLGGRQQAGGSSSGKEDSPNPADQRAQLMQAAACWAANKVPFDIGWRHPTRSSQLDEVFGAQRWDFWLCLSRRSAG
jgi:hypothetical protein